MTINLKLLLNARTFVGFTSVNYAIASLIVLFAGVLFGDSIQVAGVPTHHLVSIAGKAVVARTEHHVDVVEDDLDVVGVVAAAVGQ